MVAVKYENNIRYILQGDYLMVWTIFRCYVSLSLK